ncbi:unnamed protein product [Clavelina lepadiformis]|uniref:Cytochrome c oxidase assembly factor 6 homolog n=1 Tax=Clavelina lepadiformis TaxID=159417 RepID=A0ABP0GN28_CLALP
MEKDAGPPSAEKRRICWNARDNYLQCIQDHTLPEEQEKNCAKLKEEFDNSCPKAWVKHFIRQKAWQDYKKEVYKKRDEEK